MIVAACLVTISASQADLDLEKYHMFIIGRQRVRVLQATQQHQYSVVQAKYEVFKIDRDFSVLVLFSVKRSSKPLGQVRLEGLDKLKKIIGLFGS
jgi:hypothetical protein